MDELIREIREAFADVPYPGNAHIGTDNLTIIFRGHHWKDVSSEMLFFTRFEITSFTPEAFRFYLPAMLIAVLLDHKVIDTLPETLVYRLGPPEDEDYRDMDWGKTFRQIIELLTSPEKSIVYKFLLKCRELYPTAGWGYGDGSIEELEEAIQYWAALTGQP